VKSLSSIASPNDSQKLNNVKYFSTFLVSSSIYSSIVTDDNCKSGIKVSVVRLVLESINIPS
jgi:hypothetical protein